MKIRLSWTEVWAGVHAGCQRRIAVLERGGRDRHGARAADIAWKADIEGACAELAAARVLKCEWPAFIDQGSKPDILPDIEVRNTNPSLIVRPADYKDRRYLWVKGMAPNYDVVGWMFGGDAMREEWLTDFNKSHRPKCYCVPATELRPLSEIYDMKGS